jgi:hypothetical protein
MELPCFGISTKANISTRSKPEMLSTPSLSRLTDTGYAPLLLHALKSSTLNPSTFSPLVRLCFITDNRVVVCLGLLLTNSSPISSMLERNRETPNVFRSLGRLMVNLSTLVTLIQLSEYSLLPLKF